MSPNVFLMSDPHYGHSKMYEQPFLRPDGSPVRPWSSAEEADEEMVQRWNAVVKPCDKVYCLGDMAMRRSSIQILGRLNGKKTLIMGNHDSIWEKDLREHFRAIYAHWKLDNYVLSHVPIHPISLKSFGGNIHGHLHWGNVTTPDGGIDPRYLCVCVEQIDYTPISLEEARLRFAAQQV